MKVIRVVAAIIIDSGKVFATQRGYGEFNDGWEFPGGKIEPGETPEAAIVRMTPMGRQPVGTAFFRQKE